MQVVEVARQPERLEKLLFKLTIILRLLLFISLVRLHVPICGHALGLVPVMLGVARIVTYIFGTNRHLMTHMAANARIVVVGICLFESGLVAFTCLADVVV